jgi:hypothetical protein
MEFDVSAVEFNEEEEEVRFDIEFDDNDAVNDDDDDDDDCVCFPMKRSKNLVIISSRDNQ